MKYDVYGIGNALVDTEFEIEDDFLKEFSIEKGMMTLVDRNSKINCCLNLPSATA